MCRKYICALVLWILCVKTAESIYFIHSDIYLNIHSWERNYTHDVQALLEPDESGEIIYSRIDNQTRKSCPVLSLNQNGLVSIQPVGNSEENKPCDYVLQAQLIGTVGSRNCSKANVTLAVTLVKELDVPRKECSYKEFCFGGISKLSLQVMENSKNVSIASLGNIVESCSKEKLNYSVSVASADKEVELGVLSVEDSSSKKHFSSFNLWIRSDLDRESTPAYSFKLMCVVTSDIGETKEFTVPGSLAVLDQDDCVPYTINNTAQKTVFIDLIAHKNSEGGGNRLEPTEGMHALSVNDHDSTEVNKYQVKVVNDTKQLISIDVEHNNFTYNKNAPWTFTLLKARLTGDLTLFYGHYCILVIVNDTTLKVGRERPDVTEVRFNICLYYQEKEPTTTRLPPPGTPFGYIILILCAVFLCFEALLLFACICKHRFTGKRKSRTVDTPVAISPNGPLIRAVYGNNSRNGNVILTGTGMDYIIPRHDNHARSGLTEYLLVESKWEFPRSTLVLEEVLGEGEFGRVLKAKFKNPNDTQGRVVDVAVKMLKDNEATSGKSCRQEFMAEFSLLKQVDHHNVIKLVGVCTIEPGPPYLIMEYAEFKSLRSFLRKCRRIESIPNTSSSMGAEMTAFSSSRYLQDCDADPQYMVTPKEILGFSWQIAKGMAYLSEMKMVHRDLAARNVLLTVDKVCKISDFGLTRDVYVDDAYKKKSKDRVPVKWLAPECLADELYTTKSDVWAYGILLWELANMGASPYPGIPSEQLYSLLKSGYRMPLPSNCNVQFYALMLQCWENESFNRPTFRHLVASLGGMLEDGIDYLQLNIPSVSNPGYDFHNNTADAVPSGFQAAFVPRSSSHPFSSGTETSKGPLSDATMENLRLIDHEISTCGELLDEATQYNNTYVHTYINNERHKEESENPTDISSHQESIAIPAANTAYESPIKIKSLPVTTPAH